MRKIHFRGKTIESAGMRNAGEWAYGGYFVDDCYGGCPEGKHHIVEWNSSGLSYFAHTLVKRETVGQYSGLNDKNGKWIYEGDLAEIRNHPFEGSIKIDGVYEIGYNERMELCCGSLLLHRVLPYITVVGNVHDNPELMQAI